MTKLANAVDSAIINGERWAFGSGNVKSAVNNAIRLARPAQTDGSEVEQFSKITTGNTLAVVIEREAPGDMENGMSAKRKSAMAANPSAESVGRPYAPVSV